MAESFSDQSSRIVVRLQHDAGIGYNGTNFISEQIDVSALQLIIDGYPGCVVARLFEKTDEELEKEHIDLEQESGWKLPHLSGYYQIIARDPQQAEKICSNLKQLHPLVEEAYIDPPPELPSSGPAAAEVSVSQTKNFTCRQGYLKPAPAGVNACYAWKQPGGTGDQVQIIDIEKGWRRPDSGGSCRYRLSVNVPFETL